MIDSSGASIRKNNTNSIFIQYSDRSFALFTVSVKMSFRASHQLALPDGSMEPQHTHNWSVLAELGSEKLDKMGVVMDFNRLRALIGDILAEFDNSHLGAMAYFQRKNPSAENVAACIYQKIEPKLPQAVELQSVRVAEEPGCWAKFAK
jgi:6-pyruvoyltetrahydropterin/6-carboxytetrahydropterin synthase